MPSTAANQLAAIERILRTPRHRLELRWTAWRIPAFLNERYRLLRLWRSRITRGDMCRLRDALGQEKTGGKR